MARFTLSLLPAVNCWRVIACLVLALPGMALGSEEQIAAAVAKGDAFDQQLKTKEALAAYLEAEKLGGKDVTLLRKIAREYALTMPDTKAKDEQRVLGETAVEYAQRAVAADPRDAQAHLALAICYGRVAPLLDSRKKIACSKLVKTHVERSLALDASNDYAWHVLGAWHFELAGLNPVLRAVAQIVYESVPSASYEEAAKCFQKAIQLAPNRVAHHVELGRTYAAQGRRAPAREELNKGLALPSREKDDAETKERGRAALQKL